ncbi:TonB-dependent receptor plug domain-containing protein [Olivibacter ginsenosidimutans]
MELNKGTNQGSFLNDKLVATLMAKYYGLHIAQVQDSLSPAINDQGETIYRNIPGKRSADFHGYKSYAANARYLFAKNSGIKVSYERGFRLPMLDELFGDGVSVAANAKLSPENSDNYNAGFFGEWTTGKHRVNLESNFYLRNAKDFIYSTPVSARFVQYKNIGKVQIKGFDAEASYTYGQLFHLTANFSYQNAVDNNQYADEALGLVSITYKARIPNMPWMYGNLDFGIGKDNLLGEKSRIEFNWHTQYTHWFYLSWSSLGAKDTKNIIPTQWVHSPAVTYSWENGKYNVSFESFNLTNALAYDNFRLQKPGRSFQVKLRYFIMQ